MTVRRLAALLVLALVAAGCATGTDAVATGGTFSFVSPGGKTDILYDPPASRGTIGALAGPDLLDNAALSVADFPGKVMVINLWGQWCGPCRAEAPELKRVAEATHASGVQFPGIDVRDPQQDKAQDFVRDRAIPYPSIYDPPMRSLIALSQNYPTSVIPSTIIVDRHHRVAAVFLRGLLAGDLQPLVERIAAEPAGAP